MPIKHTNSKGKVYFLHKGQTKTKTGKEKYYFSMKSEGSLCDSIPEGYEIYEHPNAQVFLRQIPEKIILDEEVKLVEDGVKKYSSLKSYKIDVRKNAIQVYTPNQDVGALEELLSQYAPVPAKKLVVTSFIDYSPDMQFLLVGEEKRVFVVERYCYRGSIDDWINVGGPDSLDALAKKYLKHLGQESFFDLY